MNTESETRNLRIDFNRLFLKLEEIGCFFTKYGACFYLLASLFKLFLCIYLPFLDIFHLISSHNHPLLDE